MHLRPANPDDCAIVARQPWIGPEIIPLLKQVVKAVNMVAERASTAWPRAKVAVPIRPDLLGRNRLSLQLEQALIGGSVALVVAPGGTGKTSLVASWATSATLPIAWYALDPADRDPRRLLDGICQSLEQSGIGSAQARAALEGGATPTAALGVLLGSLEDRRVALVLDDFHHLDGEDEVVALFEHLFRFRPSGMALVIISRTVPLLGFAALLAMDGVLGLGSADLAFDRDEAAALLDAHGLDAAEGQALAERAGGWAAGILLMAQTRTRGIRFLHSHRETLLEQLADEILSGLPDTLQHFLLESATLGTATATEADQVLGRKDSASLYGEALERGLFVEVSDGAYRYHDLFHGWLLKRMQRKDPARCSAISQAAAQLAASSGDVPRALTNLASAKEWDALARMLEDHNRSLWFSGHHATIIQYVRELPPASASPALRLMAGYAHTARGEHQEALRIADEELAAVEDKLVWMRAAILRIQSLVLTGYYKEAVVAADAASLIALDAQLEAQSIRLGELRGTAQFRLGQVQDGRDTLLSALSAYEKGGDQAGGARTLYHLGLLLVEAGHTVDAMSYLEQAGLHYARTKDTATSSLLARARATGYALQGRLPAAIAEARRALELARVAGHPVSTCDAQLSLAEMELEAGNVRMAGELIGEADRLAERLDVPNLLSGVNRVWVKVAIARRERGQARDLIEQGRARATGPVDLAMLDALSGLLALRSGAFGRAQGELAAAVEHLEALGRPHEAARALLFLAEATLAGGSRTRAEAHLTRLGQLVAEGDYEGYLRPVAYLARRCLEERRGFRRLGTAGRSLLDALAAEGRSLLLVPDGTDRADEDERQLLRLSPFGQGRAWYRDSELDLALLPPRARELLFLAGRQTKPLPRSAILSHIWDDEPGGVSGLWDASRHLRRVLGEERWRAQAGLYSLDLEVLDDEGRFLAAAATTLGDGAMPVKLAAAEEALALFEDDGYLEWCESAWVTERRATCTGLIVEVACAAGRLYAEAGRPEAAVAACQRACRADPLDEAAHLALCEVLIGQGRVADAVGVYKHYRKLLEAELGTTPGGTLQRLIGAAVERKRG